MTFCGVRSRDRSSNDEEVSVLSSASVYFASALRGSDFVSARYGSVYATGWPGSRFFLSAEVFAPFLRANSLFCAWNSGILTLYGSDEWNTSARLENK